MSELLITNVMANSLFGKSTQAKKTQSWCHRSNLTSSWKSLETDTDTKTRFVNGYSTVEADKLLLQDFLGISNNAEVLEILLLVVEFRIWFNGTFVFALSTFVSISVINFNLSSLGLSVVIDKAILTFKQERLELNENTFNGIG